MACSFAEAKKNYETFRIVIDLATAKYDLAILQRIDQCQEMSVPIPYHRVCKTQYLNNSRQKKNTDWHLRRQKHERARKNLLTFIQEEIVENMRIFQYSFLLNLFRQFLLEEYDNQKLPKCFDTSNIQSEILQHFKDAVIFIYNHGCKHVVSASATLENIDMTYVNEENTINSSALFLRKIVLGVEKNPINDNVTAPKLIKGECEIPYALLRFYSLLLTGGDVDKIKNPKMLVLAKSYASDVIYTIHRGRVKTSKHITLGITVKSLSSSEKLLRLLHSYGHCISYSKVLELETEATYTISETEKVCPAGMVLQPSLNSGFAFDNFDRYVETCDGKDTMHDTVGISFQDHAPRVDISSEESNDGIGSDQPRRKRFRRHYEADTLVTLPLTEIPKFEGTLQLPENVNAPTNLEEARRLDRVWMISHALNIPTPMWVGFNALIANDKNIIQDIFYLTPINETPTKDYVVHETMMRSIKGAEECQQQYAQVHYDLAIASKSLKIQNSELRRNKDSILKRIFVHLGPFHIAMSQFKAIGKYIENCGLSNILIDSGLLASGSVNSFLMGKHFNRCKRLHPLMSVTIERMHFKFFTEKENIIVSDECLHFLKAFQNRKGEDISGKLVTYPTVDNVDVINILSKYEDFRRKTLNGDHGSTPKFYLTYVEMVNSYFLFDRSIRTGDIDLYKYTLPLITNLFFVFNHQNYARYLTLYHCNLENVEQSHPGMNVVVGIKRTNKPFSRREVDFTVESTINADAAKRSTGIACMKNSISARQRWSKSHALRTEIISHVLAEVLMKKREEFTNDLRKSKIEKSQLQIQQFEGSINNSLNPFSSSLKDNLLYNISNGQSASHEVHKFLMNVVEIGEEQRKKFLEQCASNPHRFEQSIQRNVIHTFKAKKIVKRQHGKVTEVKLHRDLFGRLLGISLQQNVDIEKVLEYPLTPVPLSLCHMDGTINKTDKSKLVKPLIDRENIVESIPKELDVVIIDGFFYLYTLRDIPSTFGGISYNLLRNLTNHVATEIHVIFDTYPTPSIKDYEHSIRDNLRNDDFVIEGPHTKRPANFVAELKNIKFKQALVQFLVKDWSTQDKATLIKPTQKVFLNYQLCHSYRKVAESVVSEVSEKYTCSAHEEADTKIVYHVCAVGSNTNILIKCSDTDILVILLSNIKQIHVNVGENQFNVDRKIWMQLGTGNHVKNIDVCAVYRNLGENLCSSLAAFHAFTGCDFNPAFYRKGKNRPFKVLEKSGKFQDAFIKMGHNMFVGDPLLMEQTFNVLQEYVCVLYNVKARKTVNEARCIIFERIFTPKSSNEAFKKTAMKLEATSFPPCFRELEQHLKRSTYIAQIWCNAYKQVPSTLFPINYGWVVNDGRYDFDWFHGEECPQKVCDITEPNEESGEEDDDVIGK